MKDILRQPKNTMPRIDAIYAFVSVDPEDGNEGVIAAQLGAILMPLVAADEARLQALRPLAERTARASGMEVKLVRFSVREELETISLAGGDDAG